MSSNQFLYLSKYEKKEKIGSGSFGDVFTVMDKETKIIYAAKISQKEISSELKDEVVNFTREVNIISQITYPSILQFIGFSPIDFDSNPHPVIVTEYLPIGSLEDAIYSKFDSEGWNETKILINIYGVASAMAFLHSHKILHRDLKPHNILLDSNFYPKLADFGLSKITDQETEDTLANKSVDGLKGTVNYMSPEVIESQEYKPPCDVYAFSIIVYQLMVEKVPYPKFNIFQVMNKVASNYRPKFTHEIPDVYKNLIEKCWDQSADLRPTFDEIVKELRTNKLFVTEKMDKKEFEKYIQKIDESEKRFNRNKRIFYSKFFDSKNEDDNSKPNKDEEVQIRIEETETKGENDQVKIVENENEEEEEINEEEEEINEEEEEEEEQNPVKINEKDEIKDTKEDNESSETIKINKADNNETIKTNEKNDDDSKNVKKVFEKRDSNSSINKSRLEYNYSQKTRSIYQPFNQSRISIMYKSSSPIKTMNRSATVSVKSGKNMFYPMSEIYLLNEECQLLLQKAENSPTFQFQVGASLVEGIEGFPHKPDVGIQYLKKSIEYECIESVLYYCELLLKGVAIPKDTEKAKRILKKYLKSKNGDVLCLYAKILKDEKDITNSIKFFIKATKEANNESMFELAKIYLLGLGVNKDVSKANEYFQLAKNNGNTLSELFLNIYDKMKFNELFNKLPGELQQIIISNVVVDENDEIVSINIQSESTLLIFSLGLLDSKDLIDFLISFEKEEEDGMNNVSICVDYPSVSFHRIFSILSKIKKNEMPSLFVELIISGNSTIEHLIGHNNVINSVILKQSVKQISSNSFYGCPSLKTIMISPSVISISDHAFYGCSSLVGLEIPPSVKTFGKSVFSKCSSLKNLILPPKINIIKDCFCFECCSLKSIKIPDSVTSIEDAAFFGCLSLTEIEIPSSVKKIGDDVFNGCSNLTKITIPISVKTVGKSTFCGCCSLKQIEFPSSVQKFDEALFCNCKSLKSVKIPFSENSIEESVFSGCSSLSKIEIPSSVVSIGVASFFGCSSLKEIIVPKNVKLIDVSAFSGCSCIEKIDLPEKLTKICSYAFNGCKALKKLDIPKSVKNIDEGAFFGCSSLLEINLPKSLDDGNIEKFGLDKETKINFV